MVSLAALWLPIVLAAVVVFVVSSIIHTATPWHKHDYGTLPREADVLNALRPFNIPPGEYHMPQAHGMAEMKSPEFVAKLKAGPVVMMTVFPNGPFSMGKNLAGWFAYSLIINVFAAYLTSHALNVGATYLEVFRFVGTAAFLAYGFGIWQATIWFGKSVPATVRSTLDALLYALFTAGVFGWLWPR